MLQYQKGQGFLSLSGTLFSGSFGFHHGLLPDAEVTGVGLQRRVLLTASMSTNHLASIHGGCSAPFPVYQVGQHPPG